MGMRNFHSGILRAGLSLKKDSEAAGLLQRRLSAARQGSAYGGKLLNNGYWLLVPGSWQNKENPYELLTSNQ